jgi:hypothetical protein
MNPIVQQPMQVRLSRLTHALSAEFYIGHIETRFLIYCHFMYSIK